MARIDRKLENALVAWVRTVLGSSFPVIWDKQGIDRPPLPYATLNIITAGKSEELQQEKETDDITGLTTIISREEMTVSVNIFDKGQNCIKQITFSEPAISGYFTLTIDGDTTGHIAWDADETAIQAALAALPDAYETVVTFTTAGFTIEFIGTHAEDSFANFTIDCTHLLGSDTQNCIQEITYDGNVTGGVLSLVLDGESTPTFSNSGSAAVIEARIGSLSAVSTVTVTLNGVNAGDARGYTVEFTGDAGVDFSLFVPDMSAGTPRRNATVTYVQHAANLPVTGTCTETQAGLAGDYFRKLGKLKKSFQDDEILRQLNDAGLEYSNAGKIIDLTMLLDTEYEFRGQCDFTFGYTMTDSETPQTEITRISGTIMDVDFDVSKPTI